MKIHAIRVNPGELFNTRTISLIEGNIAFRLSHNKHGKERVDIYYLYPKDSQPDDDIYWVGYKSRKGYNTHLGDQPPKKYAAQLAFLREEFDKIDWDVLEVMSILTGNKFHKVV